MDTSSLVIALHSLSQHAPGPVPIIGSHGRPVTHARYDDAARTHIARIPYDDWAAGLGKDIIRFNADPASQWLPLVESTSDAESKPEPPSLSMNPKPEPGHVAAFGEGIHQKLPGEAVAGKGEIPGTADVSHLPGEPLTPGEQHGAPDDHRVLLTQTVAEAEDKSLHTDEPVIPEAEKQLTPDEQRNATEDPRVQATETIIEGAETSANLKSKTTGLEDLPPKSEDKAKPEYPDLDETNDNYRKLRAIALREDVALPEDHDPKKLRKAIEKNRSEKAGAKK